MVIKERLEILKNTPNIMDFSSSVIKSQEVSGALENIRSVLDVSSGRISHFTKPFVYKKIAEKNPDFKVVKMTNYILPVSFNKKTSDVILNLNFFGTDDISRISYKDLYSLLVYGYCFKALASYKFKIPSSYSPLYAQFIVNIMVKLFGKDYGLLGAFASEINKLKFITNCYSAASFFGVAQNKKLYNSAAGISKYPYTDHLEEFNPEEYDLTNFRQYILALDRSKCMPGFNIYAFSVKAVRQFGFSFLPLFEDIGRYQSLMTCSDLFGTSLAPGYIRKFNESVFKAIITISQQIFRKLK
jgi:hypothetical protein